jgi:phosphoketolase
MRLILAIALQAAYQLQNQQSHNAPDLIIAEHRQRADALISMLPSDVQPLVSVCLQEAKK